jgi:hypothetical protein
MKAFVRRFRWLAIGLALGLVIAGPDFLDCTPPWGGRVHEVLNSPAILVCLFMKNHWWLLNGFQYVVVAQWTLAGAIMGIVLHRIHRHNHPT